MKKSIISVFFILFFASSFSQTIEQNFYIDFGTDDGVNGNTTTNPDTNSHYWNNVTNPFATAIKSQLINTNNTTVPYELEITNQFGSNGILNGGLLSPNPTILGNYAINSATEDYFFTDSSGSITLSSLNKDYGYKFKIFGSRETSESRETLYTIEGFNSTSGTLQTSGEDLGENGYDGNTSMIYDSEIIFPDCNGAIKITITKNTNAFAYINLLEVIEYSNISTVVYDNKFTVMGSSVANGQGANSNLGYANQYNNLLSERYNDGEGLQWDYTNVSIPGNNTIDVLNRWECDLLSEQSKYVIYGLSLFNEGIRDFGITSFKQFETNMIALIDMAKAKGKIPIVANNYPNDNYDSTDYNFIKQMNLMMHQWDVASINLLGALDDQTGKYVASYQADSSHPNTAGHTEYFYTMVPSLMDALDSGKAQPQIVENTFLSMGSTITNTQLVFTPESTVHAFTTSFEVKTTNSGDIAALSSDLGTGFLSINGTGFIEYTASTGSTITGSVAINDGLWHKITLTHYYALGKTILYVDKNEIGSYNEQIVNNSVYLHPINSPAIIDYKNWFFYRSAMTSEEIDLLCDGIMLKSSLELYAPLDGLAVLGNTPLINLAQSLNNINEELATTLSSKKDNNISRIVPNPVNDYLDVSEFSKNLKYENIIIFNALGQNVLSKDIKTSYRINLKHLKSGLYIAVLTRKFDETYKLKFMKY